MAAAGLLGVLSADGCRWHLLGLTTLADCQSGWVLGAWVSARALAPGRVARGVVVGALFARIGLAASYLYEAVAYDLQAATWQLAGSGRL